MHVKSVSSSLDLSLPIKLSLEYSTNMASPTVLLLLFGFSFRARTRRFNGRLKSQLLSSSNETSSLFLATRRHRPRVATWIIILLLICLFFSLHTSDSKCCSVWVLTALFSSFQKRSDADTTYWKYSVCYIFRQTVYAGGSRDNALHGWVLGDG